MTKVWLIYWLIVLGGFGALEGWALFTGQQTLTAYVRAVTVNWPALPLVVGIILCVVAVHLWWTK